MSKIPVPGDQPAPTTAPEAPAPAAAAPKAKAPAKKAAARPPEGPVIPKPMVDLTQPAAPASALEALAAAKPIEPGPAQPLAPPPPRKATTKKTFTPAQLAQLKAIDEESMARANIDDFLAARDGSEYLVPKHLIPEGFTVEWKNTQVMGADMPGSYMTRLEMGGWRPAPTELFRELVPAGYDKPSVERPGMILMIRPERLTDLVRQKDYEAAMSQVDDKMRQLYETPKGQLDRVVTKMNREVEAIKVRAQ